MRQVPWTSLRREYSAPDCCCRCGERADTTRKMSFTGSESGRSVAITVTFPICRACLRPIKNAQRIMVASIGVVLVGGVILEQLLGRIPPVLIPVIILVLFGSFLVVISGLREPVKYGAGTFYFTSDAYADKFAALNGMKSESMPEPRYKRWFSKA